MEHNGKYGHLGAKYGILGKQYGHLGAQYGKLGGRPKKSKTIEKKERKHYVEMCLELRILKMMAKKIEE